MQKEDLFVLKSQMDRIENGDLPVIKSIVTNIDSRLENVEQREIPNIKHMISDIKNNDLPEIRKQREIDSINISKIMNEQTEIKQLLRNALGLKPDLKLL